MPINLTLCILLLHANLIGMTWYKPNYSIMTTFNFLKYNVNLIIRPKCIRRLDWGTKPTGPPPFSKNVGFRLSTQRTVVIEINYQTHVKYSNLLNWIQGLFQNTVWGKGHTCLKFKYLLKTFRAGLTYDFTILWC